MGNFLSFVMGETFSSYILLKWILCLKKESAVARPYFVSYLMTKNLVSSKLCLCSFSDERLLLTGDDRMCTHTVNVYLLFFTTKWRLTTFAFFSCG